MKPSINYKPFSKFVLRTPLLPLGSGMSDTAIFQEAIYLASPELYGGNQSNNPKKQQKFEESRLKYHSRACTRCTPFGLFAGCSVGTIGDKTQIELQPVGNNRRVTRLDMQYLCAIIQRIENMPEVRHQLKFFPNDSLYIIGGKYRYIEYHYQKTQRIHNTASVEIDEPLELLLKNAANGATIDQLAALFVCDEISYHDAVDYIEDTINSQVLKSELDPSVVGEDVLTTLITKLSRLHNVPVLDAVKQIQALLSRIDSQPIGTTLALYQEVIGIIETLGIDYEPKFLFQTDMLKPVVRAEVSSQVTDKIGRLLNFMARITPPMEHGMLTSFIQAFQSRYEEQEVALAVVLDSELGLGYPASADGGNDICPLVSDIVFPGQMSYYLDMRISPSDRVLLQKYTECIRKDEQVVVLTDVDFKDFTFSHTLPDTLAVMCSLLGDDKLYIKSIGGASGANLLGRFCHIDDSLFDMVKQAANFEGQQNPDYIIAEISHLSESRIGNIASRPSFRGYTLHYLSNCDMDGHDIAVSDLMLSVRQGRLHLRSKKYNKQVIPRLTCAHNYSMSPIPIYRFLCDLQHQGITPGLHLRWNGYFDNLDYLPRIQYEDMILSRRRWQIKPAEVAEFDKLSNEELIVRMKELAAHRRIPCYVVVPDSDNELFVDMEDPDSLHLLLSLINQRKGIMLEEFMFDTANAVVKQAQVSYTNEVIFIYHK